METHTEQGRLMERINERAQAYGFASGDFAWFSFPHFKVQWRRTFATISFRLPDYLKDVDDDTTVDLVDSILAKITKREENELMYPQSIIDLVQDPAFATLNADKYIERMAYEGHVLDDDPAFLNECLGELVDEGHIEDTDRIIRAVWTPTDTPVGYSTTMRVLHVPCDMRADDVDKDGFKHVLYALATKLIRNLEVFGEYCDTTLRNEGPYLDGHEDLLERYGAELEF